MKKDDKIAKLLKQHGKQSPPSLDFTEMVMAQIKEETVEEFDAVRTLISTQKEGLIHSPSLAFENELFGKIVQQNTKAKVRPVFSQKSLIGLVTCVIVLSAIYTLFVQSVDNQYFNLDVINRLFEKSTINFIVLTTIIIGGGMYILDHFLRERLLIKLKK